MTATGPAQFVCATKDLWWRVDLESVGSEPEHDGRFYSQRTRAQRLVRVKEPHLTLTNL